jgi:hypothetical protein
MVHVPKKINYYWYEIHVNSDIFSSWKQTAVSLFIVDTLYVLKSESVPNSHSAKPVDDETFPYHALISRTSRKNLKIIIK